MFLHKKMKSIALTIIMLSSVFLVGCKKEFNPYKHMNLIMTASSIKDYENNAEFIDSHTSEDLRDSVHMLFYGITGAVIAEREMFVEDSDETVKLMGCYLQTVEYDQTAYWAYFEYKDDMLIDYEIYPMQISYPM